MIRKVPVVIVELTETLAGEFAGGVLADLGATVIKVEPPEGSPLRRRGPGLPGEASLYFQSENRGKYSVVAARSDLAAPGWLAPLLASADAIVEDLGPGRLEAAGPGRGRATGDDDLPDRGNVGRQLDGEAAQVEGAEIRLDEVGGGLGASAELPHLDLAMLRECAHGHEAGLEAAEQGDRGLDDRAHLEQGPVTGGQAELEQRGAQPLGGLVELA